MNDAIYTIDYDTNKCQWRAAGYVPETGRSEVTLGTGSTPVEALENLLKEIG